MTHTHTYTYTKFSLSLYLALCWADSHVFRWELNAHSSSSSSMYYILFRTFSLKMLLFHRFFPPFSFMLRIISGFYVRISQKQHAIFPAVVVWWHRDFISWAILKCHCNRAIWDCTRTLLCDEQKKRRGTSVTLEHATSYVLSWLE